MSEQYKPNIGDTPGEDARRDAVHIAVAPVASGSALLRPGDVVGFRTNSCKIAYLVNDGDYTLEPIGIVDPYLTLPIYKGDRFWLFLLPNTITNLRHVWSHPAFKVLDSVSTESRLKELGN